MAFILKVGCCGFPTSKKKYYEAYNLVELNSTFYNYPKLSLAEKWINEAPKGFEFTVKANQEISHKHRLEAKKECLEAFNKMKEICQILKARILLIQTPGSFRPCSENFMRIRDFFSKVNRGSLTIVWESRGTAWDQPQVRVKLEKLLADVDVPHVTDPFKSMPAYTGDIAYFRLHGLGAKMYYYWYRDEELKILIEKVGILEKNGRTLYILFNNLAMFEDGRRLLCYLRENTFPSLSNYIGIEAVRRLIERTHYPAPKSKLSKLFGWRLVEWEKGRQIPLSELLKKVPNKTYDSLDEVLTEIGK